MSYHDPMLKELVAFLTQVRDDRSDLNKTIDFLYSLLRKPHNEPVPLLEFVTVLKYEKPFLHSIIKPRVQLQPRLKMLFDLTLDYTTAKQRLDACLAET